MEQRKCRKIARVSVSHWHQTLLPIGLESQPQTPSVAPARRGIFRNHVVRRCKLPQTSRYLKKKNANYLCLINIHDIRPHRYAPQSNPFLPPPPSPPTRRFVRSSSLDLPASSFLTDQPTPHHSPHPRRYSRPFRRRRRITEILKYGILLAVLAPPSLSLRRGEA